MACYNTECDKQLNRNAAHPCFPNQSLCFDNENGANRVRRGIYCGAFVCLPRKVIPCVCCVQDCLLLMISPGRDGHKISKKKAASAAMVAAVDQGQVTDAVLDRMTWKELAKIYPDAGRTLLYAARNEALKQLRAMRQVKK